MSTLKQRDYREHTLDVPVEKGKPQEALWFRLPKIFLTKGNLLGTARNHECLCLSGYGAGG